jgi:hypothetical protein
MVNELPKIKYRGKMHYVDFRLGELRNVKTAMPIRFVDIKAGKYSPIKKKLRGIRAKYWWNEYIRGVDD